MSVSLTFSISSVISVAGDDSLESLYPNNYHILLQISKDDDSNAWVVFRCVSSDVGYILTNDELESDYPVCVADGYNPLDIDYPLC